MAVEQQVGELAPVLVFALVGALGVGAQWLAWRLRMPAIVLMLLAGLAVGPGLGLFDPARDIGPLMAPMVAIAVAIILFEGGLTLNLHSLRGAAEGVWRLVIIGAPLGWRDARRNCCNGRRSSTIRSARSPRCWPSRWCW